MGEDGIRELAGHELTTHGLVSGKFSAGRWEVSKYLDDYAQITYVGEPGESLDKVVRKLKKRIDDVVRGRWIDRRRRARQRSLNAS